jgi:hypothetical protein
MPVAPARMCNILHIAPGCTPKLAGNTFFLNEFGVSCQDTILHEKYALPPELNG